MFVIPSSTSVAKAQYATGARKIHRLETTMLHVQ